MKILLNDRNVELDEQVSLLRLFEKFNIAATSGVAVAVNEMIIPKKDWPSHKIIENDKILVITATQGG